VGCLQVCDFLMIWDGGDRGIWIRNEILDWFL
jgi:hypothetical protein